MKMHVVTATVAGLALAAAGMLAVTAGPAIAAPGAAAARTVPPPGGPVPAGFKPASFTFISASEGWVLGTTATCAHAPCTSVLRTTNGGRSWVGIPAPKEQLATDFSAGLIRLRFADSLDGFAYGAQLWVTHNGGSSWHRVRQVPGDIGDLEASAGVVYAASNRGNKVAIYASPADADSWHRVAGLPLVPGYALLGTITLHGSAAWIVLGGRLYSTQTGSGWVRDSFQCPKDYGIASIGAYSSPRITLLCSGFPALGSTSKELYVSADGGTNFTKVGAVPSGGDGGLLAEPTPQHLFIATASGATWLYVSTDGGKRWHDGLGFADGGEGWSDFGFTTARQGAAIEGTPAEGSRMWLTRNAGKTWMRVAF